MVSQKQEKCSWNRGLQPTLSLAGRDELCSLLSGDSLQEVWSWTETYTDRQERKQSRLAVLRWGENAPRPATPATAALKHCLTDARAAVVVVLQHFLACRLFPFASPSTPLDFPLRRSVGTQAHCSPSVCPSIGSTFSTRPYKTLTLDHD